MQPILLLIYMQIYLLVAFHSFYITSILAVIIFLCLNSII